MPPTVPISIPNAFVSQVGPIPLVQLDQNFGTIANTVNSIANGTTQITSISLVSNGGVPDLFASLIKTSVRTWRANYSNTANLFSVPTLKIDNDGNAGLAAYFADVAGGQRFWIWDSSTMPNIPQTGIPPTLAVMGDVAIGDIVSIRNNPMTYFIRSQLGLPATAVTSLFSARNQANDVDGGASITMAPLTNGGGAVSDGYVRILAYGLGTGGAANAIRFAIRTGVNAFTDIWQVNGVGGHFQAIADNSYDIGAAGAGRPRSVYVGTSLVYGTGGAILTSPSASKMQLGPADAAAPGAQTLGIQNVVAGTLNTAGNTLVIAGSQGTGTGAGGSIVFQTAPAGASGTAQNALATALTIDSTQRATFAGSITAGAGNLPLSGAGTSIVWLGGFATANGASPQTANGQRGIVTTGTLTAAALTDTTYVINNSSVTAASLIQCTNQGYSGTMVTNGIPVITSCVPGAGTITVHITNVHAANALAGTMQIGFTVLN